MALTSDKQPSGADLRRLVNEYLEKSARESVAERLWWQRRPSIENTIRLASLAEFRGKKHAHQRRIRSEVLMLGRDRLLANIGRIENCRSFEKLHELVCGSIDVVKGLGVLYKYDVAWRISAKLGFTPTVVYLHAGTLLGAKRLGIGETGTAEVEAFPADLRRLEPWQLEDFLCRFKDYL
ncbi:MAG: hypothetical protein JNM34_09230 [Chthonomonadaceae bacterium]|nr:hypothetical protein [Chthonomonadaceae bacterium]